MTNALPSAHRSSPALACRGLAAGYGARVVLAGVNLDVAAGAWTAIVGANGSGKSTLLRTLAGLAPPQAGCVMLQGRPLGAWPRRERARRLAWLAQSAGATDLSAHEVVGLGRFAHGGWLATPSSEDEAAIRRAMLATGSLPWAERRMSTLSGGERPRV